MTQLRSPRYPGLLIADLGVRFVDGVLETEDERVIARAVSLAAMGVVVDEPPAGTRRRTPRKQAKGKSTPSAGTETTASPEPPEGTPLTDEEKAHAAEAAALAERSPNPAGADEDDDGDEDEDLDDDEDEESEPRPDAPKGNATRDEWAAHADTLGVSYPQDAGRQEIRTLVAAATSAQD